MKNTVTKMKNRSGEEKDLFSDVKTTTYPVKSEKLGNLKVTLGIHEIFGIHSIFKARSAAKEFALKNEFILDSEAGTIATVQAFNAPNFFDMSVLLTILKCVESNMPGVERGAGAITIKEGKVTRIEAVTTIQSGKREFCRVLDVCPGTNVYKAIDGHLNRLRNTTITISDSTGVLNTFNLIDNYKTFGDIITIRVNNALIDLCQTRNHRVHWQAIRSLTGQVEKGLLLYLDCHNYGPDSMLWEHLLIRFLFGLKKPEPAKDGDTVKEQIEMKKYDTACKEYRRQIKDAFNVLLEEGLIKSWELRDRNKHGNKVSRSYKVNQGYRPAKKKVVMNNVTPLVAKAANPDVATNSNDCDENIPF